MSERHDLQWLGYPGHFCGARHCMFRMHTRVGPWRVSTVGDYRSPGINGYSYEEKPSEIGHGRLYETMVFRLGDDGEPVKWNEIDFDAYDTAEEATAGHLAMCVAWSYRSAFFRSEREEQHEESEREWNQEEVA